MSEIKFMEKPDWVSWEDIRKCIYSAHQKNKKRGFEMLNSMLSTEELAERLKDCHCFIALDGDEVVGTASVKLQKKRKWWTRDTVAYYCYDAILPKYSGTDVFFGINAIRWAYVNQTGVRIHQFNTAEQNKTVIKINKKDGFKLVQFAPTGEGANYYSVTMVKWDDGCPYGERFICLMFNLSKFVSKTFFRPDFKFKFWFGK